uniref:Uncharacterized protein n=1 Tax=Clastoptera arizonana TaxID=38151 RepID=A0A1B6DSM9_9HEMI
MYMYWPSIPSIILVSIAFSREIDFYSEVLIYVKDITYECIDRGESLIKELNKGKIFSKHKREQYQFDFLGEYLNVEYTIMTLKENRFDINRPEFIVLYEVFDILRKQWKNMMGDTTTVILSRTKKVLKKIQKMKKIFKLYDGNHTTTFSPSKE